jgi:hypothetical protein
MKDDLSFSYYLVVFIDILGQRDVLRKITGLPTNEKEKNEFILRIKESLGRVDFLRDSFKKYFEAHNAEDPLEFNVPPEARALFLTSLKSEASFYGISDSIIISVPLTNKNDNCTAANGIYSAFIATCGIGLAALSTGLVMRAGLDVGIAVQINDKEIYGPALERAYHLESKLAEYPRFVVGKELIGYLGWIKNQQSDSPLGLIAKDIAGLCQGMIIQDTDGRAILDFLGTKVREHTENAIDKEIFVKARNFVALQYSKFSKDDDDKLSSYYYRLMRYFKSRQNIWGVE